MKLPDHEPSTVEEKRAFIELVMTANLEVAGATDEQITQLYRDYFQKTWEWHKWKEGLSLSNSKQYNELTNRIGIRGVIDSK